MSYILDALKKADSERQHGKTPDIHSQPVRGNALENDDPAWKKTALWFAVVVLLIVLSTVLFLTNWQRSPQMPPVVSATSVAPPVAITPPAPVTPVVQNTPAPTVTLAAEPVAAAPANTVAPPVPATPPPAPAVAQVVTPPAEPVKEMVKEVHEPKPAKQTAKEKRQAAAAAKTAGASKKSENKPVTDPEIETITTTLRDLPLNIQNEIPTITVGGYLYSANRAECQLLINKMLLHEGDQVVPGLKLERMMPHSAILNYKGYRYRIAY